MGNTHHEILQGPELWSDSAAGFVNLLRARARLNSIRIIQNVTTLPYLFSFENSMKIQRKFNVAG